MSVCVCVYFRLRKVLATFKVFNIFKLILVSKIRGVCQYNVITFEITCTCITRKTYMLLPLSLKFFKLMSYKHNSYHVLFSLNCGGRVGQCAG